MMRDRGCRLRLKSKGAFARSATGVLIPAISIASAIGAAPSAVAGQETAAAGAVMGTVWDSTRMAGLPNAEVRLLESAFSGRTNADGGFFIPNVPPGTYSVVFAHPRADSLGFVPPALLIHIPAGAATRIDLTIPADFEAGLTSAEMDSVTAWLRELGVPMDSSVRSRIRAVAGEASDVHGQVVEQETRRPIPGALVQLDGAGFNAISDGSGRFNFMNVPPRSYGLRVSMLGYAEQNRELDIPAAQRLDIRVGLSTEPLRLDPIFVQARSRVLDRVGFYERMNDRATWGRFFTSIDLQRRNLLDVTDLFYSVPGARVIYGGIGRKRVVFNRLTPSGEGCTPPVYVDGQKLLNAFDVLSVISIEGLEVYLGSMTPIEYGGAGACGAIIVWTKRGG